MLFTHIIPSEIIVEPVNSTVAQLLNRSSDRGVFLAAEFLEKKERNIFSNFLLLKKLFLFNINKETNGSWTISRGNVIQ